jgi:16S rRNA (guanine527-N7)-methyltransferase
VSSCAVANSVLEDLLNTQLAALSLSIRPEDGKRLLWLGQELLRWNQKVNLTAIRAIEDVVEKHIVDSLTLLPLFKGNERLLDIGSGGGFPGLPLKIVLNGIFLVSVDAVEKKIHFQRNIVRMLGLNGCSPLHVRIEDLPQWEGLGQGFDVVVSRALTSLKEFVDCALPCLKPGGKIIAMKGPEGKKELSDIEDSLPSRNLVLIESKRLILPQSRAERLLISLMKT